MGLWFCDLDANFCIEIENYLAIYCSDSVQRLNLAGNTSKILFKDLRKPLKKVTFLKIRLVGHQNMNHLQYLNEKMFPHLNEIYVRECSLNIPPETKNIHFEKIEYFTLDFSSIYPFPFIFSNLKHLTLNGIKQIDDALCESIKNMKDLKTLEIISLNRAVSESLHKLLELQTMLSIVEEVQIVYSKFISPDDVLRFLNQSHNLRKFGVQIDRCGWNDNLNSFMQSISSNLGAKWTSHVMNPFKNANDSFIYSCYVFERVVDR